VHRQCFAQRQQVVHDREDRFFDLAGVLRAADQNHALGEIDQDEGRRVCAVARRIGLEQCGVDDRELGHEILDGFVRRDKEIASEQIVPRKFRNHAYRQPVAFVGAHVAVQRVHFPLGKIRAHAVPERIEDVRLD
jgi:hypothetical protein